MFGFASATQLPWKIRLCAKELEQLRIEHFVLLVVVQGQHFLKLLVMQKPRLEEQKLLKTPPGP